MGWLKKRRSPSNVVPLVSMLGVDESSRIVARGRSVLVHDVDVRTMMPMTVMNHRDLRKLVILMTTLWMLLLGRTWKT